MCEVVLKIKVKFQKHKLTNFYFLINNRSLFLRRINLSSNHLNIKLLKPVIIK